MPNTLLILHVGQVLQTSQQPYKMYTVVIHVLWMRTLGHRITYLPKFSHLARHGARIQSLVLGYRTLALAHCNMASGDLCMCLCDKACVGKFQVAACVSMDVNINVCDGLQMFTLMSP